MPARRHRPTPPESLEGRRLMSHAGPTGHAVKAPAVHAEATRPRPMPTGVGVLGDSLSDEYEFQTADLARARNWVEILAATRKVNFGSFSTTARGDARAQGFADDWAVSGSHSYAMTTDQLPGLVGQVEAGQVGTVAIMIGLNDFTGYGEKYKSLITSRPDAFLIGLGSYEAVAQANFDKAVSAVLAASPSVHVVVATVPDPLLTPSFLTAAAYIPGDAAVLGSESDAVAAYNAHVEAVAASDPRIALADVASVTTSLFTPGAPSQIGGTPIQLTDPGGQFQHIFVNDGFHPGTVDQGRIADAFIAALDSRFNAKIRPLSDAEIVKYARSVPGATKD